MGGDRPENRKEAYKKQKRREEGGGGGGSERRKGGGKPPRVNGMSYEKPQPAFLQKMMASGAQKARAKPDIRAEDVLPTMSERAARGGCEQWPDREGPPEESAAAAAERARVDEAEAARAREEAAAAAKLREEQAREEQARYAAGHGVQAAAGQMRVIFTKRRAEPAAEEAEADEGQKKKKKKKKKAKVKSSLLSFGDGEDDGA